MAQAAENLRHPESRPLKVWRAAATSPPAVPCDDEVGLFAKNV